MFPVSVSVRVCSACVHVVEKKQRFSPSSHHFKVLLLLMAVLILCFIDTCAMYHSTTVNGGAQIYIKKIFNSH